MEFVTVFTAFQSADADLVRARLEAASFHPQIANAISSTTIGGYSKSNLIRVEVPEAEAAEVKAFLASPDAPSE